jgi:hypothetical protein
MGTQPTDDRIRKALICLQAIKTIIRILVRVLQAAATDIKEERRLIALRLTDRPDKRAEETDKHHSQECPDLTHEDIEVLFQFHIFLAFR